MEKLVIAGREFDSRLFLGTGKFNSNEVMEQAILASGTEMVTVAMKRIDMDDKEDDMLKHIIHPNIQLLPNTSGVRDAEEAVFAAQMAREAFGTNWLKLEIHPDPRYLLPDSIETLKATEQLVKLGFIVLPYCQADPVLCKRLEEAGAATVMPLGAPIGTNKGLQTKEFLQIIIEQAGIPVVVDAGIGAPSHAAEAMELGASAVLLICALLSAEQLKEYLELAEQLGLSALVEAHDEEEVQKALTAGADFIGVNNRDLKTFEVDITNSVRLRKLVPESKIFVSESGIKNAQNVAVLRENGTNAVLIGETFMRSADKKAMLRELAGDAIE